MQKLKLILIPVLLLACQTLTPTGEVPRPDNATPSPGGVGHWNPDIVTCSNGDSHPSPQLPPSLLPTISPPQADFCRGDIRPGAS
ncbi:MAG: hypothetical protein HC806_04170 [Anaerolineae bacterium]|nr:hypothetical protein [Anaerolineae bacterium]